MKLETGGLDPGERSADSWDSGEAYEVALRFDSTTSSKTTEMPAKQSWSMPQKTPRGFFMINAPIHYITQMERPSHWVLLARMLTKMASGSTVPQKSGQNDSRSVMLREKGTMHIDVVRTWSPRFEV